MKDSISLKQGFNVFRKNMANIYLFKLNNRNTRKRCEICSKLPIKTPKRRQLRRSGVFIVKFKHILHLFLVFLLLSLKSVNVQWTRSITRDYQHIAPNEIIGRKPFCTN